MQIALKKKRFAQRVKVSLVSGFRFQVSGFRFQVSGFRFQVKGIIRYMDITRLLALIGLIGFTAFTGYAMMVSSQPLVEFGIELMSSVDTSQVVIDLYIMAVLACGWMYHDNRRRGRSWLRVFPYFAITSIFISIGPLLYIVINGISPDKKAAERPGT